MRVGRFTTLTTAAAVLRMIAGSRLAAYKPDIHASQQGFTGYAPSVYMNAFQAYVTAPCIRTESFEVHSVATGCCLLLLTNRDGSGKDQVRNHQVALNETSVMPEGHSRNAPASVKRLESNTLKVTITGEPLSNVFILNCI